MDSKVFFVVLIVFVNFQSILGQSESLACGYGLVSNVYTCNLKIVNTRGLNNFATIAGTHLSGRNDNSIISITSATGSVSSNIPSVICDKFRNLNRISLRGVGIKNILIEDRSSFTYCNLTTAIEICQDKIGEINEKSFIYNVGLLELRLWDLGLTTLPEKVFYNLINLQTLQLHKNNISSLPNNLFRYLKRLQHLNLQDNLIVTPNYRWFDTLISLNYLYLDNNLIEDLPTDVFSSLTDLIQISLSGNNLTILHSDPFGILPKLKTIQVDKCQLKAVDENLVDNTGVATFSLSNNVCVNETIADTSGSRYSMRIVLSDCFKNYGKYMGQTTTTTTKSSAITTTSTTVLPPGCIDGNFGARICELEDKNEDLIRNIGDLIQKNSKLENQNKAFGAALKQLQNQVTELTNRPCACA